VPLLNSAHLFFMIPCPGGHQIHLCFQPVIFAFNHLNRFRAFQTRHFVFRHCFCFLESGHFISQLFQFFFKSGFFLLQGSPCTGFPLEIPTHFQILSLLIYQSLFKFFILFSTFMHGHVHGPENFLAGRDGQIRPQGRNPETSLIFPVLKAFSHCCIKAFSLSASRGFSKFLNLRLRKPSTLRDNGLSSSELATRISWIAKRFPLSNEIPAFFSRCFCSAKVRQIPTTGHLNLSLVKTFLFHPGLANPKPVPFHHPYFSPVDLFWANPCFCPGQGFAYQ